jgi:phage-related minor tail protein
MNSAIDNFVKNGKFSFKDLTKSIIQDLIAIQLKAQAMSIFKGVFGGGGNLLGSIFGGGSTGLSSLPSSVNRAFADGGEPPVGVPSLVGERGAELFVPRQSGTIIPNHQLSSVLGNNSGTTINYNAPVIENMNAIDTQSATQFLAKNKMAVWSANQSANRSIPQSR